MRFTKDTKQAQVRRLWYTDDSGYKKSNDYAEVWPCYFGKLKALTIKDGVDINNFWKEFLFHTDYDADIRESDKLIIDGVDYRVKWVSTHDGITFSRLLCVLQKW